MPTEELEADVIVIGAGSSGATIAARLSEDSSRKVIVLEAGVNWDAGELPAPFRSMAPELRWSEASRSLSMLKSEYFWQGITYSSFPGDAPALYRRGRGVGGCSIVNGCLAVRPPLSGFDDWVALGCKGWSGEEVLPYFVRLESDRDFGDAPYHGKAGPIPVRHIPESAWSDLDLAFKDAVLKLGHPYAVDHNAPGAEGLSPFGVNVADTERVSTNDGYLLPARGRPNLQVIGSVLVDKVLLSGTRATGVAAIVDGEQRLFRADTVIVSAGAAMSPGILQRSGIGLADDLRRIGIEPILDLPVGESMQDHAAIHFWFPVEEGKAEPRGTEGEFGHNAFLRWSSGIADSGFNDMFVAVKNFGNVPNAMVDTLPSSAPHLIGVLSQVFSRGRVTIKSADPGDGPLIEHRLFSDSRDVTRARALYLKMADVMNEGPIAPMVGSIVDRLGDPIDFSMSEAEIDQWCRKVVQHWTHVVGTCQMGDPDSETAVVDPECRVLGTDGLRVVDASVFPEVTRANTNLTAIMFGERVADLIRGGGE